MEWLSMDSAPRDGTPIRLRGKFGDTDKACNRTGRWRPTRVDGIEYAWQVDVRPGECGFRVVRGFAEHVPECWAPINP